MHRHKKAHSTIRPFNGAIPGAPENRRAHGNVLVADHCACGAVRYANSNNGEIEQGPWRAGDER